MLRGGDDVGKGGGWSSSPSGMELVLVGLTCPGQSSCTLGTERERAGSYRGRAEA